VLSEEIIAEARYALAKIEPASINLGAFEAFLATRFTNSLLHLPMKK
jgi:hypothetical protein